MLKDITTIELDHPGATDPAYRRRRDYIAGLAQHVDDERHPRTLDYTDTENATWATIVQKLNPLHQRYAYSAFRQGRALLAFEEDRIPQLTDASATLQGLTGFRIRAIAGLIEPREFLSALSGRVMSSTQYIRHHSRPEYTPEPDIVHELLGHVPMFTDPAFAALSVAIGEAALTADDDTMAQLDRLYWYTLEFGLIRENGKIKAYGAGLLSSFGELEHAMSGGAEMRTFALKEAIKRPYNFSSMQDVLYVVEDFDRLREEVIDRFS